MSEMTTKKMLDWLRYFSPVNSMEKTMEIADRLEAYESALSWIADQYAPDDKAIINQTARRALSINNEGQ